MEIDAMDDGEVRATIEVLIELVATGRVVSDAVRASSADEVLVDNSTMFAALLLLQEGRMRPGEVADRMGMTTGGSTKVIARLMDAGLVSRVFDADPDGRAVVVSLTEKGRRVTLTAIQATAGPLRDLVARVVETTTSMR